MFKSFGSTREVFVNQDEGMFIAFPFTLDETACTLETEVIGGRKYVKAGSVVKEGAIVKGLIAEPYDITDGPVVGRVVLEGYAWASRLTVNALASLSALPKIIVMPYLYGVVQAEAEGLKVILTATEGFKFKDDIALADISATTLVPSSVTYLSPEKIAITFAADGTGTLDSIDATALLNGTGIKFKGLPIALTLVAGTAHAVTVTAGENGVATADKQTAAEGQIVTLTITPSATYKIKSVLVNDVPLAATAGAYVFVMPNEAVAVAVSFASEE